MISERAVIVVDEDIQVRQSVEDVAASLKLQCVGYSSAEDFLANHKGMGNCLVLEIRLSGMSGLELMEIMQQEGPLLPVIVVTGFADVPLAVSAMKRGAITVLEKPFRNQELWEQMRAALAIDLQNHQDAVRVAQTRKQLLTLSPGECRVLDLILAGKTNKGISLELAVGLRTVENRRHAVMQKLNVNSLAELIEAVVRVKAQSAPPSSSSRGPFELPFGNGKYPRSVKQSDGSPNARAS